MRLYNSTEVSQMLSDLKVSTQRVKRWNEKKKIKSFATYGVEDQPLFEMKEILRMRAAVEKRQKEIAEEKAKRNELITK